MIKVYRRNLVLILMIGLTFSCSTTKKKGDLSNFGKLYHNTTSRYNGYFNAQELMTESLLILEEGNEDNYDELLNVYAYQSDNPEVVYDKLDKAIEKVSVVVCRHRQSKWVDDCYLLLGKAQFLKQDFESAEETFRFFQEEFDANNIYPGDFAKTKENKKEQAKEQREIERKERDEAKKIASEDREEAKKQREEDKKNEKKAREEQKKKENKLKDEIRDLKADLKKAEKDRRDEERKLKAEYRKKKKRYPKKDPNVDPRSSKEIQLEGKIALVQAELDALRGVDTAKEEPELVVAKTEEESVDKTSEADASSTTEKKAESNEELTEEDSSDKKRPKAKQKDPPKEGMFKHTPAYYQGLLWLARTYAERDNGFSSEYLLKNLQEENNVYASIKKEIPASFAHLYLKQKDYKKAADALNEAIEVESDKHRRARYAYILGQIYEIEGNTEQALMAYDKVKDFKPKYEMRFHADLKKLTLAHKSGKSTKDHALSKLEKMYKEDKNAEYRSEIKMAIGEIYLSAGERELAIENFQAALAEDYTQKNKKAELYYKLASLFYGEEEYLDASLYYDSTLQIIEKTSNKYNEVERRAKNLKSVAKSLQVIQLQDSLLNLALLSPEEQRKRAEEIYLENKDLAVNTPTLSVEDQMKIKSEIIRKVGKSRSNFFAYNPVALSQGQRDFKRKWGRRNLEDNWRRSSRPDASIDIEEIASEEDVSDKIEESEIQRILKDIPNSESRKRIANGKIASALYDLGIAYRNDIEDFEKSNETFDRLLTEHPSYEKKAEIYYYLYLNNLDLSNNALASSYAQRLKSEYPDSEYSKILNDPGYVASIVQSENKLENHYNKTYDAFQLNNYSAVMSMVEIAESSFGKENNYAAKYALLEAMSLGSIEGKEAYIKSLTALTKRFPNSPEQARASEILRFLDGKGDAFTSALLDEEDLEAFVMADDKLHYGVVITYNMSEPEMNEAKISISNYHKKYFKLDKLKITSIYLNREEKTQIILIRKFRNKAKADLYYKSVNAKADEYLGPDASYDTFVITQRNYRELLKQKSPIGYLEFFKENYAKR